MLLSGSWSTLILIIKIIQSSFISKVCICVCMCYNMLMVVADVSWEMQQLCISELNVQNIIWPLLLYIYKPDLKCTHRYFTLLFKRQMNLFKYEDECGSGFRKKHWSCCYIFRQIHAFCILKPHAPLSLTEENSVSLRTASCDLGSKYTESWL